MEPSEKISELLFEFSNPSRLDILLLIEKKNVKPSQIARDVNQTIQETSRHLQRLTKALLVEKAMDGSYSLTPLGKQLLTLIPEIHFLALNSEYFSTHDPSCIPPEFRYGLGLIREYGTSRHVMQAFQETEELIRDSEEIIWIHSDQVLSSSLPLIQEAIHRGVEFRVILPKTLVDQRVDPEDYPDLVDHAPHQLQDRIRDSVELVIVMSEKQALLAFPTKNGAPDYLGFTLSNEEGLKWCKKLYLHFWNTSKTRDEYYNRG
ncbi:MAG: winged helix-turn-helix domain-containing protein [Candidatus Thorarchaeota archaeon]